MNTSWITLYPQWYISERNSILRDYSSFRVDEASLAKGTLCYYGELVVRPSGGAKRHPILLVYPEATPFELPTVIPLKSLPEFDERGGIKEPSEAEMFDRRHQMANGTLCLFQRETRGSEGGEWIQVSDVLRRAEKWFLGMHTGHWPPDSPESELESHFSGIGNVLLTKTFYSAEINGAGEFYMVRDMRRLVDGVTNEDPPLIVTAISQRNGVVEAVFDARADLQNIFPWIGLEAWSPKKLAELAAEENAGKKPDDFRDLVTEHGFWWSLPKEPQPFHNGKGFLRELQAASADGDAWRMLSDILGKDLNPYSKYFFAFRYPGRSREFEWLVLCMPEQAKSTPGGGQIIAVDDSQKRSVFDSTPVYSCRVQGARPEDIHLRNETVVRPSVRDKTVALVGLGALGSKVAELLAQAGVGKFRLCDFDRLATGNVARHIGGLSDFGAKKTRIVASRLYDINPYLHIDRVHEGSVVSSLDILSQFMESADVTISTTADENVESAINQIAVLDGKTALYGRALRRASMGRVFLVRPRVDACKGCLAAYAHASKQGQSAGEEWVEITERDEDVLLHECGRPVIPASAVDLSFVAGLISRVALDLLEEHPTNSNHWIWSSGGAEDVDSRLEKPLSTLSLKFPPHEGCFACREPDVTSAILTNGAHEAIHAEVRSSFTAETGGILLGYVDEERRAVVVRATGPGPKAKKTATCFDRDVEFVQAELERAAHEFGKRALYLGEWHSHLEPDPQPSPCDVTSMCGIAEAQHYATRCPLLLIAGIDTSKLEVTVMNTWSFPLGGRVYPIEHVVNLASESD